MGATDGTNLREVKEEVERLRKRNAARTPGHDTELKEAKRLAAESIATVERTRELWDQKFATVTRAHEDGQKEDEARIARYEKRIADDGERISALERELAALKASVAESAQRSAANAAPNNSAATSLPESLLELLTRLNLQVHFPALLEEALDDVAILRSMGPIQLASNMSEIGMGASEISRLSEDLF